MDAVVIHYDVVPFDVVPNVRLYGVRYEKEERISVNSREEAENIQVPGKVILVRMKDDFVINIGVNMAYSFHKIINVKGIAIPVKITGEAVQLSYKPISEALGFIGLDIEFTPDVPFITIETEEGSKIISVSTIRDIKPEIPRDSKTPEKKKRKRARAKKSRKRRKIKSKGSRKS
ncbi:hypothetical protein GWK48_02000 [Metallosphaera tengchongensis]|uniref:Uncharacterized protein n=1 Tax=Metallosphaera tengchongensis TaxID=1532350 RepID=A0A6N0NV20_9CREN|nr:hypothetical protein [Metallosphaera tengchongensis]QKQ99327.1 hypothetical protein GWK48_02000 [Metallosphaera tengchongensis]